MPAGTSIASAPLPAEQPPTAASELAELIAWRREQLPPEFASEVVVTAIGAAPAALGARVEARTAAARARGAERVIGITLPPMG